MTKFIARKDMILHFVLEKRIHSAILVSHEGIHRQEPLDEPGDFFSYTVKKLNELYSC